MCIHKREFRATTVHEREADNRSLRYGGLSPSDFETQIAHETRGLACDLKLHHYRAGRPCYAGHSHGYVHLVDLEVTGV